MIPFFHKNDLQHTEEDEAAARARRMASRRRRKAISILFTNPVYLTAMVLAVVLLVGGIGFGIYHSVSGAASADSPGRMAEDQNPNAIGDDGTGNPDSADSTDTMRSMDNTEAAETTLSAEEEEKQKLEAEKQAVIDSYQNLGLIQLEQNSGYVNLREEPSTDGDIIGKLYANSGCEILETLDGWYQVSSGGLTGYVSAQFVLSGEEARTKALEYVREYAIVQADTLRIRKEPSTDSDLIGQGYKGERYRVERLEDGWVFNGSGYMSADYLEIRLALNEARKMNMREMVLNLYDNLCVSNVTGYLNIRDKADKEKGKIIGKMPGNCGGEVLETLDGWYKIKSGPVTGYVSAEYLKTGTEAQQAAMEHAELMAIVQADKLNVRKEPSTDSPIWTQISNSERYAVVSQTDGWVEIELDTDNAFVSTEFVDVRYAIPEAIKFTPLEDSGQGSSGSKKSVSKRTQIVNYAMQFLGNRYVWGGTSLTKGVDCSGFTMQIMKHFGVSLPHYSGSQAKCGKKISSSQMRPGDLIFYTNSGGKINHVALYIGNGQIIHAASRRSGIKISSWNYRTPARIVNVLGD